MKKVILTKGLPASGKSTWSKKMLDDNKNSYKRVSKDDLRAMLDNSYHSRDTEKFILKVRDSLILLALEEGKHVIVDDTNFSEKHINRITQLVKGKAVVEIKDFTDVPVEECIKRDLKRPVSVGEKVIRDMYNQFLKPKPEVIEYDPELPDAILCDLDGTLALLNGRNPYDASTCENDIVNEPVLAVLHSLGVNNRVIFVSGREDKYKVQTLNWLMKYGQGFGTDLHMRASGDFRPDEIVKREIFDRKIRGHYNVKFVIDDRLKVCRMWHQLGLKLFRVGDPDSDF